MKERVLSQLLLVRIRNISEQKLEFNHFLHWNDSASENIHQPHLIVSFNLPEFRIKFQKFHCRLSCHSNCYHNNPEQIVNSGSPIFFYILKIQFASFYHKFYHFSYRKLSPDFNINMSLNSLIIKFISHYIDITRRPYWSRILIFETETEKQCPTKNDKIRSSISFHYINIYQQKNLGWMSTKK